MFRAILHPRHHPRHRSTVPAPFPVVILPVVLLLSTVLLISPVQADFLTPGASISYGMDDLVAVSGGAVTGASPQYQIHESVIISATDILTIAPGTELVFDDTAGVIRLEINGSLLANGAETDSIRFTSIAAGYGDYEGIDFRNTVPGSVFEMRYCVIEYAADAIDVVSSSATVEHCLLRYNGNKAVDLTGSDSVIRNCTIRDNYRQTIYMTLSSSPLIEGNLIVGNNVENSSPYPFINIGLQGVNSPTIRDNSIIGGNHMSGGIAIWNDSNGVIENNRIEGCGYGILCYQFNANPLIAGNTILNNNIHPDTVNWGFGIACNGQNAPVIARNSIGGHYYGVAMINGAQPNVGDLGNADPLDDGWNLFLGNGLGGDQYELYNNTGLDIMAENNWWGTDDPVEIENRIVHSVDDPSLGTVDFDPFQLTVSVDDSGEPVVDGRRSNPALLGTPEIYPSPARRDINLTFALSRDSRVHASILDVTGRRVKSLFDGDLLAGRHSLDWSGDDLQGVAVPAGLYFWRVTAGEDTKVGKLILVK